MRIVSTSLLLICLGLSPIVAAAGDRAGEKKGAPPEVLRWLGPQDWRRDTAGPVVSLGAPGEFDDCHIFAPCVARVDDRYYLWYCGSTGTVDKRVFDLGLAISRDGREFARYSNTPVFRFGDGVRSILTPTLLRSPDGEVLRENGRLRLWFSGADFEGKGAPQAMHETRSKDGIHWEAPSAAQLEGVYAPTILKDGDLYKLWYTDVRTEPWCYRYAESRDGRDWTVHPEPVLEADEAWEHGRLFYPTVVKWDGVYVMWYGSYWAGHSHKTALGVAASLDGVHWHKSPHNPVVRPDPDRPWESHYVTSQSVRRMEDGSIRMWFASRKEPPHVNKYFAINTAVWSGPKAIDGGDKK